MNSKNRIRQLRESNNLTLPELSTKLMESNQLKLSSDAISKYERGDREPKLATWEKLADYFKVPVDYLQGRSDDKVGWHLWEENTGYKQETIKAQISQLTKSGRISKDDDIQKQIGTAVAYLNGSGKTDKNAVASARMGISELDNRIHDDFYLDPSKFPKDNTINSTSKLFNASELYNGSLYYDDMHKEVYDHISDILQDARQKLAELENKTPNK
ncbi:helix-turn-helix transcriptional regulator [Pediococcus inopinatus]|uniref:helix-turn-helix domain-containing protein n=1 Tax=Pediococcus inopinatus TaxID=114090 RepID=UPI002A6AB40C|nr:helix-turn-helix transcriptional regulator [Pediococcus inopinatus]WPP09824.1 helix-turn-helix transcriptional regulator [Pediococcus inopinatus]